MLIAGSKDRLFKIFWWMVMSEEIRAGYKQTEVGVIPSDWEVKHLGAHFNVISGIGFSKSEYSEYGIKLLRIDNVSHGIISWESIAFLPFQYKEKFSKFVIKDGDILLALNRPITQGELKIAIVEEKDTPCILYQRVGKIIFLDDNNHNKFVYYLLSKCIRNFVLENSIGSDQPFISTVQLKKLSLPFPPQAEQRSIAQVLSDTDALITSLDKLIAKKRDIKQAAMQQLLTGKLRLPGFDRSGGKFKQTAIGAIPCDWEVKKLGDLADITRGASPRPIDSPIWFDKRSSVGWVRISDVTKSSKFLEETTQKLSTLGIEQSRFVGINNLIMSICATVGRPILTTIDVCIHDGFVVFSNLTIPKEYLYYFLTFIEKDWSKNGQTGSQMNLNTELINCTSILCPKDKSEQKMIAQVLSDMDAEITTLEQRRDKTKALKQGMMQELLTGRIRLKA
jgi:type I restriction enzyme S subunit